MLTDFMDVTIIDGMNNTSRGKQMTVANVNQKTSSIVSSLFEYKLIADAGSGYCVYQEITLKQQIGDFLVGTKLPQAAISYEEGELELFDDQGDAYYFRCFLAINGFSKKNH